MPQYVINKVVMQEVENQLDKGLSRTLHRRKYTPWPIFPLRIRLYELKSHMTLAIKTEELNCLHFTTKYFHAFDHRRIGRKHFERIKHHTRYSSLC